MNIRPMPHLELIEARIAVRQQIGDRDRTAGGDQAPPGLALDAADAPIGNKLSWASSHGCGAPPIAVMLIPDYSDYSWSPRRAG
jgi:hypothetical protein